MDKLRSVQLLVIELFDRVNLGGISPRIIGVVSMLLIWIIVTVACLVAGWEAM